METKEQKNRRAELLSNVKSLQKLAEVSDVRTESYKLFVNAIGDYLRAEEGRSEEMDQVVQDFAVVVNDLATGIETLVARLRSTSAIILGVRP